VCVRLSLQIKRLLPYLLTYLLTYVCICIFVLCILLYYCDDVRLSHLNKHYVHVGWLVVAVSEAVRCHGEAANWRARSLREDETERRTQGESLVPNAFIAAVHTRAISLEKLCQLGRMKGFNFYWSNCITITWLYWAPFWLQVYPVWTARL